MSRSPPCSAMDDKRHCPLPTQGKGGSRATTTQSAVQAEWERERCRAWAREQSNMVSSTPDRAKRGGSNGDEASGVPCKVPRFQYVDFPSLHQCIRQLSVPPLENWLAGCRVSVGRPPPAGLAPSTTTAASPKERAPKFKYVDYPSLYHCIQQLSVPPLESWSSGLPQPRAGDNGQSGGARATSQTAAVPSTREDQATQTSPSPPRRDVASQAARELEGSSALLSLHHDLTGRRPGTNVTASRKRKQSASPSFAPLSAGSKTGRPRGSSSPDDGPMGSSPPMQQGSSPGSRSGVSACPDPGGAQPGPKATTRPSVISLHPGKKQPPWKHHPGPLPGCPSDASSFSEALRRRAQLEGRVCPLCQEVFAGPQELREHQEDSH
ncbi:translation initiation factor IF-2 isoform X1 [Engraulis encrasicolus]|uniref:translation initiation factor IF-2 isoform X1 n=2 Tax=Engraulis encrasicolus TaxID=184585 RepID=UPI002FD00C30